MNKNQLSKNIKASIKAIPCDLVIKNINVVDVFQGETFKCDVGIIDDTIVGLGKYSGREEIDGTNKYMCPTLIDAHCHIESSMLTPKEYYKIALLHGVTSVVADPHEIANVLGLDGIKLMLNLSDNIPFDFNFMLPSCVPATNFEDSGATLKSYDLNTLLDKKNILGLGEVMNCQSLINCDDDILYKILDTISENKIIDGHGAGFNLDYINAYTTCNIKTDHECININEAVERLRRGMYVLIREGTSAKNLIDLIDVITPYNNSRLCLCTDDKHIDDLFNNGSIDYCIRTLINYGIKPEVAIKMGSLNTAQCYNIKNKGAIAPGYYADFLILDSLEEFKINSVYKKGSLVMSDNKLKDIPEDIFYKTTISSTININPISLNDFKIPINKKEILNVIEIIPNKLETNHLKFNIKELNLSQEFNSIPGDLDLLKVAVIERHKFTGNIGLGIIKGLKLKSGAIATTIAHDSHNIIVCGTNDSDMLMAVNELKRIGGGIIVVNNGEILSSIRLEVGGLMTLQSTSGVLTDLGKLHDTIKELSPNINFNPFLTLSFLSLPVIPSIKITDKGLFDVTNFKFIPVAE